MRLWPRLSLQAFCSMSSGAATKGGGLRHREGNDRHKKRWPVPPSCLLRQWLSPRRVDSLRLHGQLPERRTGLPRVEPAVAGQSGERGGCDRFGVDLEMLSQELAVVAAAEPIGPQRSLSMLCGDGSSAGSGCLSPIRQASTPLQDGHFSLGS